MSNYHVLAGGDDGNSYTIAMHIPVSSVNNQAGVNYRTAAIQYLTFLGVMPTSKVPFIDPAEQTQLNNGELVEFILSFPTFPGQTLLQKRAAIDTLFTATSTKVQAEWQKKLEFWGLNRDVP